MAFELFKTISSWIEPAVDFIAGEKEYESGDVVGRSGGFLENIVKPGAKAYVAMTEKGDDREAFQAVQYKEPKITRYTGRAARGDLPAGGIAPVGMRNPEIQTLVRNLMQRQYANPQMSRIQQDFGVRRTIPQGKRTLAVEAARIPSATETTIAAVRKEED